jgi:hypothetical protein
VSREGSRFLCILRRGNEVVSGLVEVEANRETNRECSRFMARGEEVLRKWGKCPGFFLEKNSKKNSKKTSKKGNGRSAHSTVEADVRREDRRLLLRSRKSSVDPSYQRGRRPSARARIPVCQYKVL